MRPFLNLLVAFCVPWSALAQPKTEVRQGWETQQQCWRDGTVEDCRGQLVERKAYFQAGVPAYLEFWDKNTLVGLAVNLGGNYVNCDKLGKKFVCELTALPIPAPVGLSKASMRVFDDRESLMEAGVDALEIYRLNLPWEAVRVVALESDGTIRLSVPLENQPRDLKAASFEQDKKKERGTTFKFYVVPRVFSLEK